MNTSKNSKLPQLDWTTVEQEPIHTPGSIQPHGVLLTLKEPELIITQISENSLHFLGFSPQELLHQSLSKLLDCEQLEFLRDCLQQEVIEIANPIQFHITSSQNFPYFDGIIHRYQGVLILELEPTFPEKTHVYYKFYNLVKDALNQLQPAKNIEELSQIIARGVRKITEFDRVMLYQFDEDGNGKVIAEDKQENLTPYLGLHYPALDIPPLARQFYTQNWLRFIPDVDYQSAAIIPTVNPLTNEPLDLSKSVLRSVSSCHIEYLQNMGVKATMTISLLKKNKLWGLIACHHYTPKYIPYEIRNACEFLGQVTSLEIAAKEENENSEYKIKIKSVQAKLVEYMSAEENFIYGLINYEPNILNLVNAQGAVVCFENKFYFVGKTPQQQQVQDLLTWINQNQTEEIFYTDCLSSVYPEAEKFKDVASGLIALSISKSNNNYVLWFRPEVVQTVNWGGNPQQSIELTEDNNLRLSPRKSFETWKQIVRLKSVPWKSWEVNAALDLRNAIISVVLRKIDELAKLNTELERSNQELDAFAYIASHDLKEPLRGIHNYSNFLMEDYGEILNEEGKAKLKTLVRLTQRMEDLIDSLLRFSRLGRVDLLMQPTDLNMVLQRILDLLSARIEETKVTISIPRPLPVVYCDRVQVGEVFSNLITNAIKYNDKAEKWVEIGYTETSETVTLYVQDNGIGIRQKHFEAIFRIFKRLHSPNKYGGGTGAGLTIAKKIVERHGGKIWVESTYGEGSTFYFTLQKANLSS